MRLRSTSVCTPAGEEWLIGRRWVTRERPHWRRVPAGKAATEVLSVPDIGGPDDLAVTLAIIVGAVVFAVIVIPLLLFGIKLILLGAGDRCGYRRARTAWPSVDRQARRTGETAAAFS